MAEAGASKKDNNPCYILHCCALCNDMFRSEDALKNHIRACKLAWESEAITIKDEPITIKDEAVTIKDEPQDAADGVAPAEADQPPLLPPASSAPLQQCVPRPVVFAPQAVAPPQMPELASPTHMVSSQPFQVSGQPADTHSPQSQLKPQYHSAAKSLTASELLRQRFQKVQQPDSLGTAPPDSKTGKHGQNNKDTASMKHGSVRNILPKGKFPIETLPDDDDTSLPKIDKVYFTSGGSGASNVTYHGTKLKNQKSRPTYQSVPLSESLVKSPSKNQTYEMTSQTNIPKYKKRPRYKKFRLTDELKRQQELLAKDKTFVLSDSLKQQQSLISKETGGKEGVHIRPRPKDVLQQALPDTPESQSKNKTLQQALAPQSLSKNQSTNLPQQALAHQSQSLKNTFPQQALSTSSQSQSINPMQQLMLQTPQGLIPVSSFSNMHNNVISTQGMLSNSTTRLQQRMLPQNIIQAQNAQLSQNLIQVQNAQPNVQNMFFMNGQAVPITTLQHMSVPTSGLQTTVLSTAPPTPTLINPSSQTAFTPVGCPRPGSIVVNPTVSQQADAGGKFDLAPQTGVTSSSKTKFTPSSQSLAAIHKLVDVIDASADFTGKKFQMQVPNPNGSGFFLLTRDFKPPPSVANVQMPATSQGTNPTLVANQPQGFMQQNPGSNVVLLPPVMSQGHILNGIHMQPANLTTGTTQNEKPTLIDQSSVQDIAVSNVNNNPLLLKPKLQKTDTSLLANEDVSSNLSSDPKQVTPTASGTPDTAVLDVAKLLLFGGQGEDFKKRGPVVLADGRIFVPVAYIGPYTLRSSSVIKPCESELISKQEEKLENKKCKGLNEKAADNNLGKQVANVAPAPPQTITLSGDVVWIFLDTDGPKILWNMGSDKKHVMVLPLEFQLPKEASRQLVEVLKRSKVEFPPGLINKMPGAPVWKPEYIKKLAKKYQAEPDVLLKMSQIMGGNTKNILPKGGVPAQVTSKLPPSKPLCSPTEEKCKSPTAIPHAAQPMLVKSKPKGHLTNKKEDTTEEDSETQDTLGYQSESQSSLSVAYPTQMQDEIQDHAPHSQSGTASKTLSMQDGTGSIKPRLTVNSDTKTVKRALQARVKLERISLTADQQQQMLCLQMEIKRKKKLRRDVKLVQEHQPKIGIETEPTQISAKQKKDRPEKVKKRQIWTSTLKESATASPNAEKRIRKRKGKTIQQSEPIVSDVEMEGPGWIPESGDKKTETVVKMETEEDSLDSSVRRSVRNVSKPRTDYSVLDSKGDMAEGLNELIATLEEESSTVTKRGKGHSPKGTSGSVPASRSLGKHAGFHVYIESAENCEEEDVEDSNTDVENDEMDVEDTCGDETDNLSMGIGAESESSNEQFILRHHTDIKQRASGKDILYQCTICGSFMSVSADQLVSHLKEHYSGQLTCNSCGFKVASQQDLIEHDALEHTGKPLYHCDTCDTPFFSLSIYNNHLRRHGNSVKCLECGASFPNDGGLKEHTERAHPQDCICHMCNQHFVSEEKVLNHYSQCQPGYQCPLCYVRMRTMEDIGQHIESTHNIYRDRLCCCKVEGCWVTCLTPQELEKHAASHKRGMVQVLKVAGLDVSC